MALCPAHNDHEPSLSIHEGDKGKAVLKCFAGCTVVEIVQAMGLELKHLFPQDNPKVKASKGRNATSLTLAQLADAKHLDIDFLKSLGCTDCIHKGQAAVRLPYYDESGKEVAIRYRMALAKDADGKDNRFVWQHGATTALYGLNRLDAIREAGWVLLEEGESDAWTCWQQGTPALGVPGKQNWKSEWKDYISDLDVYVWQEPDAEDFTAKIAKDIPGLKVIVASEFKDLSEAHIRGIDVPSFLERAKASAATVEELARRAREKEVSRHSHGAASVLAHRDPFEVVKSGIRRLGYGGDLTPALIVYLAGTSRLLKMRPGSMPVHLLLLGPASAGKSYTVNTILRLLPSSAYVVIDAGSPRVLIYDESDLRHRIIVFAEADSLPAGEDNPAASAIRNLLQEHELVYKVTVKGEGGGYVVKDIKRPGPRAVFN